MDRNANAASTPAAGKSRAPALERNEDNDQLLFSEGELSQEEVDDLSPSQYAALVADYRRAGALQKATAERLVTKTEGDDASAEAPPRKGGRGAPKRGDLITTGSGVTGIFVGRRSGVDWLAYDDASFAKMAARFDASKTLDDIYQEMQRENRQSRRSRARGYADAEPIALTTLAVAGLVAAPRLNVAIKARPLGQQIPPSAGASALFLLGGGLARRQGYRRTGNAGIALGVGLGVGTILSSKSEGGMLAAK